MRRLLHDPAVRDRLRRLRPLYDKVFRRRKDYGGHPTPAQRVANMEGRGVFLLCFGRSGSTVFADFLASHPRITTFGEVLGEDSYHSYFQWLSRGPLWIWPLRPTMMEQEFYRFAEGLVRRAGGRHGLFDMKLESLHLIEGNWRVPGPDFRLYDYLQEARAPVILLTRRDLVARYVSGQVAERRGAFHSYQGRAGAEIAPFEVDLAELRDQVARIGACHRAIRDRFAGHDNFVEIAYEDLFVQEGETSRFADGLSTRMAALLGLEDSFDTTPRLQRMSGPGYAGLITNRDAVEAYRQEVLAQG